MWTKLTNDLVTAQTKGWHNCSFSHVGPNTHVSQDVPCKHQYYTMYSIHMHYAVVQCVLANIYPSSVSASGRVINWDDILWVKMSQSATTILLAKKWFFYVQLCKFLSLMLFKVSNIKVSLSVKQCFNICLYLLYLIIYSLTRRLTSKDHYSYCTWLFLLILWREDPGFGVGQPSAGLPDLLFTLCPHSALNISQMSGVPTAFVNTGGFPIKKPWAFLLPLPPCGDPYSSGAL